MQIMAEAREIDEQLSTLFIPDVDGDKAYPMNEPWIGRALIINNVAEEMPGTRMDVLALTKAFQLARFEVRVEYNCNKEKMGKLKRWIMKSATHKMSNTFALVVISHGNEQGYLMDKNHVKSWRIEDFITDLSLVDSLMGKPKIMIVQACRGDKFNSGKAVAKNQTLSRLALPDDLEAPAYLPDKSDMFLSFATVPGYIAHGGDERGSHYLQVFAAYLGRHFMTRDLCTIHEMVNQYMSTVKQGEYDIMHCPEYRTTFRFKLRFSEFYSKNSGQETSPTFSLTQPNLVSRKGSWGVSLGAEPSSSVSLNTQDAEKKSKVINAELLVTYPTGLKFWNRTQFIVMPSGIVILWNKVSTDRPPALVFFCIDSNGWKMLKKVPGFCEHEGIALLAVSEIQVAVSFADCRKIRLYDTISGGRTTVFESSFFKPKQMCYAEAKKIFIYNATTKSSGTVDEMKASKTAFTVLTKTITSGIRPFQSMCYVPGPNKLLVLSGYVQKIIQAVNMETDTIEWELEGMIDEAMCQPHDLLYSHRHHCVLLADGHNCRILVLSPDDGTHLQTLHLPLEGDYVINLSIHGDQLLVYHVSAATQEEKVSYFSIN